MTEKEVVGSSALQQPDYWWFKARGWFFSTLFAKYIPTGARMLDAGSSNSPSTRWMENYGEYIPMDLDPRGLPPQGVEGSILAIPFEDETIDVTSAFDIIEHVSDDELAVKELYRVLKPGGVLFLSVPAYEWAWSENDVHNAHYRRYTKRRMQRLLKRAGFKIERSTYGFHNTFPIFSGNVLLSQWKERKNPAVELGHGEVHQMVPVATWQEKILLRLCDSENRAFARGKNYRYGSSLFICARKPWA